MNEIAVTVGRFQVDELHEGHRKLIEKCLRFDSCIIFIGCSEAINTWDNPLPFELRKAMIEEAYPSRNMTICPLYDRSCDVEWVGILQKLVQFIKKPGDTPVFIGGHNSYLKLCNKMNEFDYSETSIELPRYDACSGTYIRCRIGDEPKSDVNFRRGIIWASQNRYPTVYSTVDVAYVNIEKKQVLMGSKSPHGGSVQFIGGFLDSQDLSLKDAAEREFEEETGYKIESQLTHIASVSVDDHRYQNSFDSIMTHLFVAFCPDEIPYFKATDDIELLQWVDLTEESMELHVKENHKPLFKIVMEHVLETLR